MISIIGILKKLGDIPFVSYPTVSTDYNATPLPNSELVDVIDEGLDTKSNCVSDEMVDIAESVHKAHGGNLLKLTTNAFDNINMVLGLFLAILQLDKTSYTSWLVFILTILRLSLAKPKLSYVPAVFPTQSYPNCSVPSSAYSCMKEPMEKVVLSAKFWLQIARQQFCDLGQGYVSWLRGQFWEILRCKKRAVGVRIVQLGKRS